MSARSCSSSEAVALDAAPPDWHVRAAEAHDVYAIAGAVAKLLLELGAAPPPAQAMRGATQALLEDRAAGGLLVAEAGGGLVGVLTASWQTAIHVPGRYALIQDLWVDPSWRGKGIGAGLLDALLTSARHLGIARIEVGLPKVSFSGLPATEAFYRASGFSSLGPRMRAVLA